MWITTYCITKQLIINDNITTNISINLVKREREREREIKWEKERGVREKKGRERQIYKYIRPKFRASREREKERERILTTIELFYRGTILWFLIYSNNSKFPSPLFFSLFGPGQKNWGETFVTTRSLTQGTEVSWSKLKPQINTIFAA